MLLTFTVMLLGTSVVAVVFYRYGRTDGERLANKQLRADLNAMIAEWTKRRDQGNARFAVELAGLVRLRQILGEIK